jgi:hypothetical protein
MLCVFVGMLCVFLGSRRSYVGHPRPKSDALYVY